jgi:hypothetical protein
MLGFLAMTKKMFKEAKNNLWYSIAEHLRNDTDVQKIVDEIAVAEST